LIITNLLSGTLAGMNCVLGKLFAICASQPHIIANPLLIVFETGNWITGILVVISVFSNLINLNITISLYSQLLTMPTYECCIIFGTFMSGGFVMGEFFYYSHT